MSTLLYGHDGQPLLVSRGAGVARLKPGTDVVKREDPDAQLQETVSKRVRTQAVSIGSVWDRERGKNKPTPVTFETLRLIARRNDWIAAIIKTRKNQVADIDWTITVKDTDDPSGAAARMARDLERMLRHPNLKGSRPTSMSWRQFVGMWVDDLLTLDAGCIEKERDAHGWIVACYPVDGSTIRPNMDDKGGYTDDAYVQVVDGVVTARFGVEDLIYCMDNPQTDVKFYGYGLSPVEQLIISVTADLHAQKFNAAYFDSGAIPEGMLHLGEDVGPEDVDAFRHYWLTEIAGKPHSMPIMGGGKGPEFLQWRESNRDMQFMEYQSWLLQKMCAVFQISQQELGQLEDVNRSTADSQESSNERKGIRPLLALIKDTIDLEIVGEHGQGLGDYLEFSWEQAGEGADAINAKYQPMVESGAATRGEWREAHGMDPQGDPAATHGREGLGMHLTGGQLQPLPGPKDADVLGAAAQQDREDDQQQQQQAREDVVGDRDHQRALEQKEAEGGPPTGAPWQPGNADDPDVKQAMADHDKERGIGPRQVGKTAPGGWDRHPALTDREDDLTDVFTRSAHHLMEQIAEVIGG